MAQTRKPELIYVVEDEAAIARLIADTLEKFGYRAETFRTAEAFFHGLRHQVPDLVILDLGMPDIDGYEAATRIRAALAPPPLLIAVSGWGQDEDRRRSAAAGFDHHLVKPADGAAILEALGTGLPARRVAGEARE